MLIINCLYHVIVGIIPVAYNGVNFKNLIWLQAYFTLLNIVVSLTVLAVIVGAEAGEIGDRR